MTSGKNDLMPQTVFEGKRVFVRERDGWEFVERKKATEAVVVLAKTEDGRIILVEQYRRPVDARVIEFPAGLIDDPSLDAEATARKELDEEAGYGCTTLEEVAAGPSSPGITSEIIRFFRAAGVTRTGDGGGVEGEDITVHLVPERDAVDWLNEKERQGVLIDAKLWSGLYLMR